MSSPTLKLVEEEQEGYLKQVNEQIAVIVGPLMQERETLQAKRAALIAEREAVDGALVRVERMLRAAGVLEKPEPKQPPKQKSKQQVSQTRVEQVIQVLMDADKPLRITDVAQTLHWNGTTTKAALSQAHEQGFIRLVGQEGRSNLYAPKRETVTDG